jgi:hypothetical protein
MKELYRTYVLPKGCNFTLSGRTENGEGCWTEKYRVYKITNVGNAMCQMSQIFLQMKLLIGEKVNSVMEIMWSG